MEELGGEFAGLPGDDDGYHQGRHQHGNAQRTPQHAPGDIFHEPEQDVQVFDAPEPGRDAIEFVGHAIVLKVAKLRNTMVFGAGSPYLGRCGVGSTYSAP